MEVTYRIVPWRGTYWLEAVTGSDRKTMATYRTEEPAIAHLKRLQAKAEADHRKHLLALLGQPSANKASAR